MNLQRNRRKPMIPMSSMSDIGFLLLIFIMLISLMNQRHEEHIEYTEASKIEKTQEKDNLEIWILKNGQMAVEGQEISYGDLELLVAQTITEKPLTRVHIIADRNTPYKYVNGAVSMLQKIQHRVVSFVVKEAL